MSRLALIAALLLPLAAVAEEIEEHAGQHAVPWAKLVFSTINFAIFVYLIYRLAWPAARTWVSERRSQIADALAKAELAKREAEALRAEWQQRMEHLAAELEAMLQQARADIATERDQILANAHRAADTIRRDAQRTAENEIRLAQESLRAEVAAQALAIAERLAHQRLTPADQQRFLREFVQQVSA